VAASYKKLFKLMIDREIKNKDLATMADRVIEIKDGVIES
jgi:DNA-binding Xre family transcriptional regulator